MAKLSKAEKEKRKPKFFAKLFSSPRKDKAKAASKKAEATSMAKKKMYAAESMFKSAKAAGKKEFTWKGKRYHTRTKD